MNNDVIFDSEYIFKRGMFRICFKYLFEWWNKNSYIQGDRYNERNSY